MCVTIRRSLLVVLFALGMQFTLLAPLEAQPRKARADREGKLRPGDQAPDFTLVDVSGKTTVTLSRLQGKPVVLYFGSCT